jgi:hypothetical protein
MKQSRKFMTSFQRESVQLSCERTNISELAKLGVTALSYINGEKSEDFGEGSFPVNGNVKANARASSSELERKQKDGNRT